MNFKDAVLLDVDKVFANASEMAATYNIDGAQVTGVLTQDKFEQRTKRTSSEYAEGIAVHGAYFSCATHYFKRKPVFDEVLRINGEQFIVQNVEEKMGMYSITLLRHAGR